MNLVEPQWAQPFDVTDLEAAVSLAADLGMPMMIALDHIGAADAEVLEIPYGRRLDPNEDVQVMIWNDAGGAGFMLMDNSTTECGTKVFSDVLAAVRFADLVNREGWPG
jgi:hypothetical protein